MQNLSQDILDQLESRNATPLPRWYFVLMRGLFWLLVAVSTFVGALAFSVGWYVFFDNDGLHVTWQNIFYVIPYIWLVVLGIFVACAYTGFRHTRRGYRHSGPVLLGLILLASVALGLIFDTYDLGLKTHKYLLTHTNVYDALIYSSEDQPD